MQTALLHCPIRGPLNVSALAKDGLTATEEARRIDFIKFILDRGYPESHVSVETVVIKQLGESGRNKLRCDVLAYSNPISKFKHDDINIRLPKALLVAEIKRDSRKSATAIEHQLEPALRLLPSMQVMGAYWDDINRSLYTKQIVGSQLEIFQDCLANLPRFGNTYKRKLITFHDLEPSQNLVAVLFDIANVMRSHGINDEQTRYKETVKLLLARYCDEREAAVARSKPLSLQVYPDGDVDFLERVAAIYKMASKRYSRAKTLFGSGPITELSERTLREIIRKIQGVNFQAASNDTMQQVFMSFVPAVFKKALDQYFTPIELVKSMVGMVQIGPNDKVADPGMGTADFLTAAVDFRNEAGDADVAQRVYGMDSDAKAFDLAVVNMILNKDGSSNLSCEDSIANHGKFSDDMGVVLCNPPFGEKSIEDRHSVLGNYDLGHVWRSTGGGVWEKTDVVVAKQQLGILFIERSFKLLEDGGRLGIILPEGYLSTPVYGYVRQWLTDNFRILAAVELPRRIFVKSNADLRSNVIIAQKVSKARLDRMKADDYPIYADMIRKVGFKMGKGYSPIYVRDSETGIEIRDMDNQRIVDTDFRRVGEGFKAFSEQTRWADSAVRQFPQKDWAGATISDVLDHGALDLKPRRLMASALANVSDIKAGQHIALSAIADVVKDRFDLLKGDPSQFWRPVAGLDIRAVEGVVTPSHPVRAWQIAEQKDAKVLRLKHGDIIIGLVRPERRNIGLLLSSDDDIVGIPDGIAVVRVKPERSSQYPQEWLFAALRSEQSRLQFWTESGGTSYGKLSDGQIENLMLAIPSDIEMQQIKARIVEWSGAVQKSYSDWATIGSDADRKPIVNSSGFGLLATGDADNDDEDAD